MKFNPFKYSEVKANAEIESPQGLLHVMCSENCNVYVTCQGVEALAGYGREVRVQIADAFIFRVEAVKTARVFIEDPQKVFYTPKGEVFTNMDRKPQESGTMLAIKQGLRSLQLKEMSILNTMREFDKRTRASAPKEPQQPDPAEEPRSDQQVEEPDPKKEEPKDE